MDELRCGSKADDTDCCWGVVSVFKLYANPNTPDMAMS